MKIIHYENIISYGLEGLKISSNSSKYSEEMKKRSARHVIENRNSASTTAKELGINTNTACLWVRYYRRKD